MELKEEHWFRSTLFDVESGEDLDANPGIFGKQLSEWLHQKFYDLGYSEADAYPDDWGWRVDCQRSPFTLYVACAAFVEAGTYDSSKPVPDHNDVLWYVFPGLRTPLLRRSSGKADTDAAYEEFCAQLETLLTEEPAIKLTEKPGRGEWELPPPSVEFREASGPVTPNPLSLWASIPLGLLMILGLPFMCIALLEILTDPPAGREVEVISLSLVVLIPIIFMVKLGTQLLFARLKLLDGLVTTTMLRVIAIAVLVLPLWTVRAGYHSMYPLEFSIQVIGHFLVFAFLWWLAKVRAGREQTVPGQNDG